MRSSKNQKRKDLAMDSLFQDLRHIVGINHVLTEGDLSAWEIDWRKRYHGRALAVVRPANTGEVAAVVRACILHGVVFIPQGGNTGLVGGGVPDNSGQQVIISLTRMRQVRAIDADNLTMTVEAGCVLQAVQQAAEEAGLLFPLSLAAEGSCTIGGNLSTNAGGTQVLRYGNARELCLGLEVVTASGDIWNGLTGLRKDNTGYDLRDLFVGSEGTLGIITAATLKLHPRPAARVTAMAACESVDQAVTLLARSRTHLDAGLTGFELMSAFAMQLVARHFPQIPQPLQDSPWYVLLDTVGHDEAFVRGRLEHVLEQALEAEVISNAVVAESLTQSKALWHLRESIPLAQAEEGLNIKHDISLPTSAIPAFVAHTDVQLQKLVPGARLVNFGHLGDGNLHYNVQCPENTDAKAFLAAHEREVNTLVFDAVRSFGGSISAEHGIGELKRDCLPEYKSHVALGLMRAIKQALDPRGLLNPRRVIDTDTHRAHGS